MKIGVVSDTHRNTTLLGDVAEWLCRRQSVSMICHLGDEYEDVAGLAELYVDILQVPGIYHPGYRDGSIPAKAVETIQGLRVLLVHSVDKDLSENEAMAADIILHGHTHEAKLKADDGRLYMNPGHLKADMDKHFPASFGILDIQDRTVFAAIYNLKHEVVERMELAREENGLYKSS